MNNSSLIWNGRLVDPYEIIEPGWVLVENGTIKELGQGKPAQDERIGRNITQIDAQGNYIVPGFIDTHVCAMLNHDCRQGRKAYLVIAEGLLKYGITSFLPTIIATPAEEMVDLIAQAKKVQEESNLGSEILGVHLEGPYLGEKYRGLTLSEQLREPNAQRDKDLYEAIPGFVKIMTLAPELPGCLAYIRYLKEQGVVSSISHTEIDNMADLNDAIEAGASHVTHIFNAMELRGLKEAGVDSPGFADLAIIEDRLTVSLIADGVHVCPELINLLVRAKDHDKIVLITDCFMATGMPEGIYTYPDGQDVIMDGTCHRTVEGKILAGSILTLNRAVKNVIDWTGLPVTEVLPMATANPARLIGVDDKKGALKPGLDGDIVIADEDWNAIKTIQAGKVVFG